MEGVGGGGERGVREEDCAEFVEFREGERIEWVARDGRGVVVLPSAYFRVFEDESVFGGE